jgi:hypothetical protein
MEFISSDLDFNEFSISERFKPFLDRKFGIWLEDSKFKSSALNKRHLTKAGLEFQNEIWSNGFEFNLLH